MTPGQLYTYLELQKAADDRIHELVVMSIPIWKDELEKAKAKWRKEFKHKRYTDFAIMLERLDQMDYVGLPDTEKDIHDIEHHLGSIPLKGVLSKKKFQIIVHACKNETEQVPGLSEYKHWIINMDVETFLVKDPSERLRKIAKKRIKAHYDLLVKRYLNSK